MKKTAEFETTVNVAPDEIRHFVIELNLGEGEDFCTLQELTLEKASSNFMLLDLSWVYEDRQEELLSQIGWLKKRYELHNVLLPRGASLRATVKNFSSFPQTFKGSVIFETITGEIDEGAKPSILNRCKRWFIAGLEVAAKDRLAPEKKPPAYLSLPSVRESARTIVASLASLVELPAMAAALYWRSISDTSLSEAGISEAGLSEATPSQPILLHRVAFPTEVFVSPHLGRDRYAIGEDGVEKIELLGEWMTFTMRSLLGKNIYEVDVLLMPGTLIERMVDDKRTIAGT